MQKKFDFHLDFKNSTYFRKKKQKKDSVFSFDLESKLYNFELFTLLIKSPSS